GDVIGSAATADGTVVPFLWKNGVMTSLRLGAGAQAVAINDSDQVAANFNGRALLWQDGVVTDLGELSPGGGAGPADINDAGQVVGTGGGRAYVYEGGVVTDRNALVPAGTPGLGSASAINDAGQILGYTTSGRAFLLTPDRPATAGTEWIVDDGAADFALSGARAGVTSEGYLGDSRRLAPTTRTLGSRRMLLSDRFRSAATWTFAGLDPGTYR